MSAREVILGKVRTALGGGANAQSRTQAVANRLDAPIRHPVPARASGKNSDELLALFTGYLQGQSATVVSVQGSRDIPRAVATYLRETNLPARVRSGGDGYLSALPWDSEPTLQVETGPARPTDEVGLSHAAAGVAETGTLLMASGPDNPVTLNFLPETHIVVIERSRITGPYEDAWSKLRDRFGPGGLPRTVNMISGPSRTGDIGGRLVMGAHGPRRLCVIIVGV